MVDSQSRSTMSTEKVRRLLPALARIAERVAHDLPTDERVQDALLPDLGLGSDVQREREELGRWIGVLQAVRAETSLPQAAASAPDGSDVRVLAPSSGSVWAHSPVWSPDGTWTASVSASEASAGENHSDLYVVRPTGGSPMLPMTDGQTYEWRPVWLPRAQPRRMPRQADGQGEHDDQ